MTRKEQPNVLPLEGEIDLHVSPEVAGSLRTVPSGPGKTATELSVDRRRSLLGLPQENILYFLEKSAPRLQSWPKSALEIYRAI